VPGSLYFRVRGQLRGRKQDSIWHSSQKNICQKLEAPEQQRCCVPSWLWHHAGSQRQKKAKDGGIKEDGKTERKRKREHFREVTA